MKIKRIYGLIALIVSFFVLFLFLLLGLIIVIFFLQNLLTGLSGFGWIQILYLLMGIYMIYRVSKNIIFLVKNKDNFDRLFDDYVKANKNVLLLSLFYSGISYGFDFYVNIVLYLPIFVLENVAFIVNIFLLRYNLMFLTPLIKLILPIAEILFLFSISGYLRMFLKNKNRNY
jgi:hypothetical protein